MPFLEKANSYAPEFLMALFGDFPDALATCIGIAVDLGIDNADQVSAKMIESKYRVRRM